MDDRNHLPGQGQAEWIQQALARHERQLLGYAQRITGCPELARDVVQDTFLKLCRKSPQELDGHLAEWLYTVCRNAALDTRRKEDRMTTSVEARLGAAPASDRLPEELAENRDTAGRVLALLLELPANQQEVVRLKFHGSLSYREIAGVTGLTVSNVGYLLHQALTTLRHKLRAEL